MDPNAAPVRTSPRGVGVDDPATQCPELQEGDIVALDKSTSPGRPPPSHRPQAWWCARGHAAVARLPTNPREHARGFVYLVTTKIGDLGPPT